MEQVSKCLTVDQHYCTTDLLPCRLAAFHLPANATLVAALDFSTSKSFLANDASPVLPSVAISAMNATYVITGISIFAITTECVITDIVGQWYEVDAWS